MSFRIESDIPPPQQKSPFGQCICIKEGFPKVIEKELQELFEKTFQEWAANNAKDYPTMGVSRETLAHSELLLLNYHQWLKSRLEKQGIHI